MSKHLLKGGSTWPTRPYMPARVLSPDPSRHVRVIAEELLGGPRGVAWRDGAIYVSLKGGYHTQIVRYDLATGKRTQRRQPRTCPGCGRTFQAAPGQRTCSRSCGSRARTWPLSSNGAGSYAKNA